MKGHQIASYININLEADVIRLVRGLFPRVDIYLEYKTRKGTKFLVSQLCASHWNLDWDRLAVANIRAVLEFLSEWLGCSGNELIRYMM